MAKFSRFSRALRDKIIRFLKQVLIGFTKFQRFALHIAKIANRLSGAIASLVKSIDLKVHFALIILTFLVLLSLSAYDQSSSQAEVASRMIPTSTDTIQAPLSTRGSEIVDKTGRAVLLRGVNWFGLETESQTPHGLWARDYKEMLAQIKQLGYNLIRLPYSVKGLQEKNVSGINFDLGSNRDLQGKAPLEVMDAIVEEAGRQGLMVLLDSHRLSSDPPELGGADHIPELWYGDGFTEADWMNTWTMLAQRYKNQPNVIGADLKNEPHGKASWGTNDKATDWRLAAERAGNAILKVNPNWLIVVEGVEKNVPGQQLKQHWMGGNLEGVRKFPVRLAVRNKVVYSPHEYGAGVYEQPWFAEKRFPKNLSDRWEKGFYYIARQNIAPILIGEFGGRKVDAESKEGIWQRQFVEFVKQHQLSFAYWSWNPNSADTGGILLDDWSAIDEPKQALLNQLLPVSRLQSVLPKPSSLPSFAIKPVLKPIRQPVSPINSSLTPTLKPQPITSTPPLFSVNQLGKTRDLKVNLMIQSDWKEGFCVNQEVTNPNRAVVSNWRLKFLMHQAAITQTWNGTFEKQNSHYTVTPPEWGRNVQPNQTISMGFCAKKLGTDYLPKQITVTSSKQL